LIDFLIG